MNTLSKQNKRTEDGEGETSAGDSTMFERDVVDLPLAKSNDDQHLVKNDISEDGEQGKKKKKKKRSRERKHEDSEYNQFKSDECEEGDDGKKMKKKKKLIEGNTLNVGNEDGERVKKLKKKKKKRSEESEHKDYKEDKSNECEDDDQGKKMKKQLKPIEENTLNECNDFSSNEGEGGEQAKKLKKKKKKRSEESEHQDHNKVKSNECEEHDHEKKVKKKKKKLIEGGRLEECNDVINNGDGDQGKTKKKNKPSHKRKSKKDNDFNSNQDEVNDQGKKMKEKKEAKAVTNESPNSASKPKRVTFSEQVEKFCCDGLLRGERFTPEEDEKIKASVYDFINSHGLGDEGVDMVMHSSCHRETRGCWKVIAQALPYRPKQSVYTRAHVLFENNVFFHWTPEEREFVRKSFEQHGADWRPVADALGKSRDQVKDLWRRIKYDGLKRGPWSQDEYQTLFNLVNEDLRIRASEPYRRSQHGMLRDNICWEAISHKLKTRDSAVCCLKWYRELVSSNTGSGEWLDSDDFRMIGALYDLDACCMEEVDWDYLIEHRSGDACRQRWDQMVQHIGDGAGKSFIEQVEILAKRFCPDLLEAREAFENKPVTC
ncbi:RNA polymerase I termination factor [Vicia villosa]|uniref:RNA polymerase I termination factor n=1 Tax=Vicia villosa TaxID=3911 RepID=UPI00273B5B04|nr:RNA polymerase I termination factor [Vicia villosa]